VEGRLCKTMTLSSSCELPLRVGQNHTFIGIYGVHTESLAGKSLYIRSYTVQIYGSGQPYSHSVALSEFD